MIDWKKSADLNGFTVESLKARFIRFPKSHKLVVVMCDSCDKERCIPFSNYRNLCHTCAQRIKWENEELHIEQSLAQTKRWSDPEEREKQRVAMVKNHKNNPDVWDEQNKKLSITMEIIHKEHPESWDTDAVKKGRIKQRLTIKENHKNNPDVGERHSAWFQGQDYDGGEWTGYTDKSRPHIVPTHACIQINDWFEGCHGHHITKSIIVFIPAELHNHFKPHNLRSGLNMGEINAVAIQFVNGGLNI